MPTPPNPSPPLPDATDRRLHRAAAGTGPRRAWLAGVAGVALALLGACAGGRAAALGYTLGPAEVQALVQRSFPVERRVVDVVDARADSAQVRLLPEADRIGAVVELQARDRVFGSRWSGRLDFDARLRWDAADRALKLHEVRVQSFQLQEATGAAAGAVGAERLQRLAAVAAERLLEGLPLVRLDAARKAQLDLFGVQPAAVRVTPAGLQITFEPATR